MDLPFWLPLLCGLVVGVSLGLTGGGGSIFALPLLLFVLAVPLREAVAVSLAVVGLTALFGAFVQCRSILWGAGILLGVGGVFGAPAGAWIGSVLPESLSLVLFSALMVFIGLRMVRRGKADEVPLTRYACARDEAGEMHFHWACAAKLALAGVLTGVLSGIFGVGGGFLVVPALLLVTAMPMERILGTSLVGIALISGSAFVANLAAAEGFPLVLASWFLLGGLGGMLGGNAGKTLFSSTGLKRFFAIAVFGVAGWTLLRTVLSAF